MQQVIRWITSIGLAMGLTLACSQNKEINKENIEDIMTPKEHFISFIQSADFEKHKESLAYLEENWKPEYNSVGIELAYLTPYRHVEKGLLDILSKENDIDFNYNYNQWYEWLWNQPEQKADFYHEVKAWMHARIDSKFPKYFLDREDEITIRLDEVRWGGVRQDGIPPLRNPKMLSVEDASYLEDDNIVFGISVNGDARAYPKRILAWHEMFTDTVGDTPVAGVYCTLCGTVILYKTELNGTQYNIGTSGFLYRSNKLMYDQATQSLWNTIGGTPVIGPLVGKGIELEYLSVVTTTWGEWKKLHPETTVLDVNTGFQRDYGEGVAYQEYFATDRLMFNVPAIDTSLKNKQSILALRFPEHSNEQLAISVDYLRDMPIYQGDLGTQKFVVLTDKTGANRVYNATEDMQFVSVNFIKNTVVDKAGNTWTISEDSLTNSNGDQLQRLPSYNAFWFGFKAAYPDTKLIK